MAEEQEEPLTRPSAERVLKRAYVLAGIGCRAHIEADPDKPDAEPFRADMVEWLKERGAWDEAEPREIEVLTAKTGSLTPHQEINASWRIEGLAVLAWSLKRFDMPRYDLQIDGPEAAQALGFLEDEEWQPRLRSEDEIEIQLERIIAVHWRLRRVLKRAWLA